MRTTLRCALPLVLMTALGAGCGRNRLQLDVDVRSFMQQDDLEHDYETSPLLPFAVRLDPVQINLVEGFRDFGRAEEVSIEVTVAYENTTGQGRGVFLVHFDATAASVSASQPVAVLEADLVAGQTTTSQTRIAADARLLDLFTSKELWMGLEMRWEPATSEALQGRAIIAQLDARIVSTLDVF